MTKNELREIYHINNEIQDLKNRIEELEAEYLKATRLSGEMVETSGNSDRVGDLACKIADLRNLYKLKLEELYIKKVTVERFIGSIKDSEIRSIFRLRHINCMEWQEIAEELNYHRVTVCNKYYNYIKNSLHSTT